jgi:type IV secretory pathway VirB2 component (pilin)
MTARELCEAGEQYACRVQDAMNGDTARVIAVIIIGLTLFAAYLIWSATR